MTNNIYVRPVWDIIEKLPTLEDELSVYPPRLRLAIAIAKQLPETNAKVTDWIKTTGERLFLLQWHPISVDIAALVDLRDTATVEAHAATEAFQKLVEQNGGPFKINIQSPKQISAYLYNNLSLRPFKGTSVAADALRQLIVWCETERPEIVPVIQALIDARKAASRLRGLNTVFSSVTDGAVKPTVVPLAGVTGRFSVSKPNVTAFSGEVKNMYHANEGYDLLSIDFRQFELRLLASFVGGRLAEAVTHADANNEDAFAVMASSMKCDADRTTVKRLTYGQIYGIGLNSAADTLGMSRKKAAELRNAFVAAYPELMEYAEQAVTLAAQAVLMGAEALLTTLDGMPVVLETAGQDAPAHHLSIAETGETDNEPIVDVQGERMRAAALKVYENADHETMGRIMALSRRIRNYTVQASASAIFARSCVALGSVYGIRLLLPIHDEVLLEVPTTMPSETVEKAFASSLTLEHGITLPFEVARGRTLADASLPANDDVLEGILDE